VAIDIAALGFDRSSAALSDLNRLQAAAATSAADNCFYTLMAAMDGVDGGRLTFYARALGADIDLSIYDIDRAICLN
jgi:hypothetical protein